MRTVPLVASAIIGGAVVGLVLFIGNLVDIRVEIRRAPNGSAPKPATVASPDPSQSARLSQSSPPPSTSFEDQGPAASSGTASQIIERASKLAAAGKLLEAQELYLQVLLVNPDDREAMRGLVRVRRLMAGGDPSALRQHARTYQRAISQGVETGEHYTAPAMNLLATASLLAAAELEGSTPKRRVSKPPPPPTAPLTASKPTASKAVPSKPQGARSQPQPQPAVRPRAAAPPAKPTPVQKPPSPIAQPAPTPEPPLNVNEPFVTITVGPIASGERASAITTELTVAGYVARVRRGVSTSDYVITLGPYRRSVAERIAALIRSRFGNLPVVLSPSSRSSPSDSP